MASQMHHLNPDNHLDFHHRNHDIDMNRAHGVSSIVKQVAKIGLF